MRILHVFYQSPPNITGGAIRNKYIMEFQNKAGLDAIAVTAPFQPPLNENLDDDHEVINGVTYYRTGGPGSPQGTMDARRNVFQRAFRLAKLIPFTRKLNELARELRPDIIHAHEVSFTAIPAAIVGRRLNIPTIYEMRSIFEDGMVAKGKLAENGPAYKLIRGLESHAMRRSSALVVIAGGIESDIVERGIVDKPIHHVPNGVDPDYFRPLPADAELRQELGIRATDTVIGFVGTVTGIEGVDNLLMAFEKVAARRPDAKLLVVGTGDRLPLLKDLAAELGLQDRINFVGQVPHADIPRYYSLIDMCAVPRPSNRCSELVTPLKPLEAMACGKTVIAADVGGLRELISNNETGVLANADDPTAYSDAILKLIDDPELRDRLGKNARSWTQNERNWREVVDRYKPVYDDVLAGHVSKLGKNLPSSPQA